jgi:hypothetical protein
MFNFLLLLVIMNSKALILSNYLCMIDINTYIKQARVNVIGCDALLQAGESRVRISMVIGFISIFLILPVVL